MLHIYCGIFSFSNALAQKYMLPERAQSRWTFKKEEKDNLFP